METSSKLITVTGATGFQGTAVVDALLAKGYRVRGLTSNSDSAAAKALADRGVEVQRLDPDSKESLLKAFRDSHGVFLNTNTHASAGDVAREVQQGELAVDAAQQAAVTHLVFSSLEAPGLPASESGSNKEAYRLPDFEAKSQISVRRLFC
ncbi:hypothetical protein WJX73_006404 [Symbiochloris irregularis]|uniref:NmrA-like domain-containing protein n=1 Tax=Symbiochloris irregularis TaxID=706552 RepID=A0AAW1NT45_9CHLO